jgi:hypothetical protein
MSNNLHDTPGINDPWSVVYYEVLMYWGTRNVIHQVLRLPDEAVIRNAVVESMVLHTRILIDILLSKGTEKSDDIRLKAILPNWVAKEGKDLLKQLSDVYGKWNIPNSPCWVINKMLAHPTKFRTSSFNYTDTLRKVDPVVYEILQALSKRTRRPALFPYVQQ